jgi:hypothetical protein
MDMIHVVFVLEGYTAVAAPAALQNQDVLHVGWRMSAADGFLVGNSVPFLCVNPRSMLFYIARSISSLALSELLGAFSAAYSTQLVIALSVIDLMSPAYGRIALCFVLGMIRSKVGF